MKFDHQKLIIVLIFAGIAGVSILSYLTWFTHSNANNINTVLTDNAKCNEPYLESLSDLPCSEAVAKTKEYYTKFGVLGYLYVESTEHFDYLAKKIPWGWENSFKEKIDYANSEFTGFLVTLTDVYYVKTARDQNDPPEDTFYILGVYNISQDEVTEYNPKFRGFLSMGNQGCVPTIDKKIVFECDATTENYGETPHINTNAKPLYAKFEYDQNNKQFTLVDSTNKDLFQAPYNTQ